MNLKQKLVTVKTKVKENAPAIVSIGTTLVGIGACVYAVVIIDKCKTGTIPLTKEDREMLKTGDFDIHYRIDGCDYSLKHIGPDHV